MKKEKSIEERVAETFLEKPIQVTIGNKAYEAAPPTIATLILVSEAIAEMPKFKFDSSRVVDEVLATARDCRVLGDIAAILILGARNLTKTVTTRQTVLKRYLWGLIKKPYEITTTEVVDRKAKLAREILENLSPTDLHGLVASILSRMELGDFFGLTTFLTEVNLLRQTKVETATTASGQSSQA